LAIFCATFWFTDRTTNHHPPAPRIDPAEVAALRAARAHRPRVFVLILDSLRYATATDPAIMPHLGALRHEGVYARVDPGFNSSSAAALRDAFTGRENASALAVVSTFLKTDAGVESIFHQLALAGLTSAAYGQDFFTQFGAGVRHQTVINYRSPRELEEANILAAVEALRRGDDDFVIGHLTYTDYAAHDFGIYDPAYREAFVRADAFIPRVRAALPPDTTFIVMGDHGHDEQGKHGFGMDVPTFTVYVGTPFRRDRDIGPINLPTHRFLMSYAAGIPLNVAGYTGRFPVEALDGRHDEVGPLMAQAEAARSGAGQRAWLVWLQISLLGALCFNLYCRGHSPLDFRGGRALLPWLGLAPLAIAHDWQPALGLTVLGLITAWLARGVPVRQLLRWVAVPTLAGLAFNGWGRAVLALRPTLQALPTAALVIAGLGVALAGALASTRARRPWVTGVVFAVLLLLLPPTSERYGFPAMLVPLLGCWFLFHAVSLWREASPAMRPAGGLLLTGAGLVLLTQPFVSTLALNGSFVGWQPLVPGLDWQNLPLMAGLAFLAKLVIFFPRRPGWGAALLGLGLTVLLLLSETQLGRPNS
ncbi:MAG TPA: alkaline phosphatase family protein, partial [Lacunisphaera sp.]